MNKINKIINNYRRKKALHDFLIECIYLITFFIFIFIVAIYFENIFYLSIYLRSKLAFLYLSLFCISLSYLLGKLIINFYSLFNYNDNYKIASDLGLKLKTIKDQLLNVIQINNQKDSLNADLKKFATKNIYLKLSKIYKSEIYLSYPKFISKIFFIIAVVLLLLFSSSSYRNATSRLVNYNTRFSPPLPFVLTSLSESFSALSQDTIYINIAGIGDLPDSVSFYWINDGIEKNQFITHEKEIYKMKFEDIKSNIIYWAEFNSNKFFSSWDKIYTEKDTIIVKNRPQIKNILFTIIPPEYTKNSPYIETLTNINQANILKGSKITIAGDVSKDLNSAWLLSNNNRINLEVLNNNFFGELILNENLLFSIYYLDNELIPNINPKQYLFILEEDKAPNITVQSPKNEFEIDETMIIPVTANIVDDYGLTELSIEYEVLSQDFPEFNQQTTIMILKNNINNNSYSIDMNWDINNIQISMGDELHFKIVTKDNNAIDGFQISKSQVIIGKFPTLENLFSEIEALEEYNENLIDDIESSLEDISSITEDIKMELLKSDETTWEQEQKLENTFEEVEEISSKIEEIQENINKILEKAENNQLFDNELINKFEKFQELLEAIMSEELYEAMQQLQNAFENLDIDQITEALDNFNFNITQFEEQLDRYIDMFETAMAEQQLNELSEHIENMIEKQNDLIDDIKNNQDEYVLEKKSSKQENRFSEFKNLLNETSNALEDISENISNQLSDLSTDQIIEDTGDLLQEQTKNGNNQNNTEPSNLAKNNLEDIGEMINEIQDQFQNQIVQKLTKEFIKIIDNLLTISNQQENLISQTKGINSNNPHLKDLNRNQDSIDRQLNQVTKQLIDLSNNTFFINPKINRLIGKVKSSISKAISYFEQKKISTARQEQLESLKYINDITFLLLLSMEEMQTSNSASGYEKFMESLEKMSNQQQGINQGTMQLGQLGMMQQRAMIEQLMQQQSKLRQQLEDLIGDNPTEETGGLSKAKEEMDQVITDFQTNSISKKTIERQEKILSKMLDSQKSLSQRDYSKKRISKTAGEFITSNNIDTPINYEEKKLFYISAMEKALEENLSNQYEKIIRLYFLSLQKESLKNENQ